MQIGVAVNLAALLSLLMESFVPTTAAALKHQLNVPDKYGCTLAPHRPCRS